MRLNHNELVIGQQRREIGMDVIKRGDSREIIHTAAAIPIDLDIGIVAVLHDVNEFRDVSRAAVQRGDVIDVMGGAAAGVAAL